MYKSFWQWDRGTFDVAYIETDNVQVYFTYEPKWSLFIRVIWWYAEHKQVQFGPGLRLWPLRIWLSHYNSYYYLELGPLTLEWCKLEA